MAITVTFSAEVAAVPQARQAYREPFLICVDIGGDVDLHVCSYPDDVTIDGQTYIGLGNFMGIVPVTATGERDNRSSMEVRMIVDDTVAGVADAINAVGGPPVMISIYNEKGEALPAVPTTAPGVPAGLRASDTAYNAITYAWGAVNNAAGYDLYVSTSRTDPDDDTAPTASIGNVLLYRVTGLVQNTQQYAWIRSRNAAGTSDWSGRVDTTTSRIPVPGHIRGLRATRESAFFRVTWNADPLAQGYRINRPSGQFGLPPSNDDLGTDIRLATSYATSLTGYNTFFVRAYNVSGLGPWTRVNLPAE